MIPTNFNFGSEQQNENPDLYNQLSKIYSTFSNSLNKKVTKTVNTGSDPPANSTFNANYGIGDIYVRTDTDTAWIMTSRTTANSVTWKQIT